MNLQEIKEAIAAGKTVCWKNSGYTVIKDKYNQYFIRHINGHCVGLTWSDGKKLSGNESDFYIDGKRIVITAINTHEINGYQLIINCDTITGKNNLELELELDTNLEQINPLSPELDIDDFDFSMVQPELNKITEKMVSDIITERRKGGRV
jgi:hypothetical protein